MAAASRTATASSSKPSPLSARSGPRNIRCRSGSAWSSTTVATRKRSPGRSSSSSVSKGAGLDFVSVSVGFSTPDATIPWTAPAFMAPVVEHVRRETGVPAAIAWGVGEPTVADRAIRHGQADLVKIGRALLANPRWPYEAAQALGVERPSWATLPAPYAFWLEQYRPVVAAVDN